MSAQTNAAEKQKVQAPKKAEPKPQQAEVQAPAVSPAVALGFAPPPGNSGSDGGADPLDNQATSLKDKRFPKAQRRSMARQINNKQGNRHLNRAVTKVVAREDDKRVMHGIDLSMIDIDITQPITKQGSLNTVVEGSGPAGIVKVHAPELVFQASVELQNDVEFSDDGDGFLRVGPIQTMTSSNRTGVYTRAGKVVARYSTAQGAVRDSWRYPNADGSFYAADRPFYQKPEGINTGSPSTVVDYKDRPTFPLPQHFGGGQLTRVEGADVFNTSIGIKRGGQIVMANPFGWQLDWSTTLGTDFSPSGDAESLSAEAHIRTWEEAAGIVMDTDTYAWQEMKNNPPIFTFYTLDAALTETAFSLWMALAAARNQDPISVSNIEQALVQKDPTFSIKLTNNQSVNRGWFGGANPDTIGIFANVTKQSKLQGPFTLEEGGSTTIGIKLSEIIDPSSINGSSTMKVWAGGFGDEDILGDFATLTYPFLSQASLSPTNSDMEGGSYTVQVSMS